MHPGSGYPSLVGLARAGRLQRTYAGCCCVYHRECVDDGPNERMRAPCCGCFQASTTDYHSSIVSLLSVSKSYVRHGKGGGGGAAILFLPGLYSASCYRDDDKVCNVMYEVCATWTVCTVRTYGIHDIRKLWQSGSGSQKDALCWCFLPSGRRRGTRLQSMYGIIPAVVSNRSFSLPFPFPFPFPFFFPIFLFLCA